MLVVLLDGDQAGARVDVCAAHVASSSADAGGLARYGTEPGSTIHSTLCRVTDAMRSKSWS